MVIFNENKLGTFEQLQQENQRQWLKYLQDYPKEETGVEIARHLVDRAELDAVFRDMLMGMFRAYGYWLLSTGAHTWAAQHTDKNKDNVGSFERFDNLADAITYIFEDMGGTRCRSQE